MAISQNFPEEGPTLNLNFAGSKTLDPHITFSRTSIGTYMDDSGLIVTAPTDSPRFDHNDVTGESLGLLVEEQRTNLILYSVVSTANWTSNSQTPVSLSLNALGVFPGVRIASGGAIFDGVRHPNITLTSGTTYTATWYLRKGDVNPSNKFRAIIRDQLNAKVTSFEKSSASTDYGDINSYSFSQNSLATTNFEILSVDTLADGLTFKICTKFTASASSDYRFMFQTNSTTVGETIIALGLQVEAGAFPTSYIPTSGSTVTRNPDNPYIEGTKFTEFYNSTEGSAVCHFSSPTEYGRTNASPFVFSINRNTIGWGHYVSSGGSSVSPFRNSSNSNEAFLNTGSAAGTTDQNRKLSVGYKLNDFAQYVNIGGGNVSERTDTLGEVRNDINAFAFNPQHSGLRHFSGHIKNFSYYPTKLTNTQLQTLAK